MWKQGRGRSDKRWMSTPPLLTRPDHHFSISVSLGEHTANVLMITDRIPSVGDLLDFDPAGAFVITGVEHYVSKDEDNVYRLRKTHVTCKKWDGSRRSGTAA